MKGEETMASRQIEVVNERGEVVVVEDGIIPDKCRLRIPLFLTDAVQQGIAANARLPVRDAFGRPAGFRPGYVFGASTRSTGARDAAFAERARFLSDAWRAETPGSNAPAASAVETRDDAPLAYEAYRARLSGGWRTAR